MLLQGFSVPLKNKDLLFTTMGFYLEPRQNRMLQLAFRNQIYEIMLTNDAFDRVKYPEHKEIIQFRYIHLMHCRLHYVKNMQIQST